MFAILFAAAVASVCASGGITLTSKHTALSCGDQVTLTWSYDSSASNFFVGKAGDDTKINIMLYVDGVVSDEFVGQVSTTNYPATSKTFTLPKPWPASYSAAGVDNDGAAVRLRFQLIALKNGDVNSNCGIFCGDPDFQGSCNPAATTSSGPPRLQLGYPTLLSLKKNTPCVVDVFPSVGASTMRIYADVSDLTAGLTLNTITVAANRYRNAQPSISNGTGDNVAQNNGDVMIAVDRPTLGGAPEKWWIVVNAERDIDVLLSASCYDLADQARISTNYGRRTGLIAVEDSEPMIFSSYVDALPKVTRVTVNIDAAKFLALIDTYTLYVNIITLDTIKDFVSTLSWKDIASALSTLNNIFNQGKAAQLPAFLTPTAQKADLTLSPSTWTGKTFFDLPAMQDALVIVSIVGKKGLGLTGRTAYSVKFSLGDDDGMPRYEPGVCGTANRRRSVDDVAAVLAAGNTCADKPCDACFNDANCSYCWSAPVGESKCRPKATACTATTGAPFVATSAAQCKACSKTTDPTSCRTNTADQCDYCSVVSAGSAFSTCADKWSCAEYAGAKVDDSTTTGASTLNGQTTPAGTGSMTGATNAASIETVATIISFCIVFIALL